MFPDGIAIDITPEQLRWWSILAVIHYVSSFFMILGAIRRSSPNKVLSRTEYLVRLTIILAILTGLLAFNSYYKNLALLNLAIVLVPIGFLTAWSVHRLQDIGSSRRLALLLAVPGIRLLFPLVILAIPRKRSAEEILRDAYNIPPDRRWN